MQCEDAFISLKTHLISPPILSFPDFHAVFTMDTDASLDGVGVVLSQQNDRCVFAYAKVLCSPNLSNSTIPLIVQCWLLYGQFKYQTLPVGQSVFCRTDHSALQWLWNIKDPRGQVARWWKSCLNMISKFSIVLVSSTAMLTLCQDFHANNVGFQSCQEWVLLVLLTF